jgi:AraC-like DNA-binding protein
MNESEIWIKLAEQSRYSAIVLAERLHISRRQLQRYTKKMFGSSPQRWLSERRLIVAPEMLKEYQLIKIVASELNFKRANHFSREFKRVYGISPTAFIRHYGPEMSVSDTICPS